METKFNGTKFKKYLRKNASTLVVAGVLTLGAPPLLQAQLANNPNQYNGGGNGNYHDWQRRMDWENRMIHMQEGWIRDERRYGMDRNTIEQHERNLNNQRMRFDHEREQMGREGNWGAERGRGWNGRGNNQWGRNGRGYGSSRNSNRNNGWGQGGYGGGMRSRSSGGQRGSRGGFPPVHTGPVHNGTPHASGGGHSQGGSTKHH